MIQLIVGEKGKGKTKKLLERVDMAVKSSNGSLVYIDKSQKHMYELNNRVRLINASEYPLQSCPEFVGFLCGIISQDHDLDTIFLDNFMSIACLPKEGIGPAITRLHEVSQVFDVNLVICISVDESNLPEEAKPYVYLAL